MLTALAGRELHFALAPGLWVLNEVKVLYLGMQEYFSGRERASVIEPVQHCFYGFWQRQGVLCQIVQFLFGKGLKPNPIYQ